MPVPYQIRIPDDVITDLKRRLAATRWPDEFENDDWSRGTNRAYLMDLCRYWETGFDWNARQDGLNTFAQFTTPLDGLNIHFIHEKGKGATSTPILLIHGWPDSFVRFLKIVPLLTEADETGHSFDVVIPSIPGFPLSDRPERSGMTPKKIASLFADLMTRELSYDGFIAHGGDWGSAIAEQLALYHESHVRGLHLTDVPVLHAMMPVSDPGTAEKTYLAAMKALAMKEGGYFLEQATKPQTLGYGLNDSPAGLAAWIIEKFHAATDNRGRPEDAIPRDELLTNLTLYWATQTATSAVRIYYEAARSVQQAQTLLANLNPFNKEGSRSKPPAAFAMFPKDISHAPREFAERFFNVVRWEKMPRGGHFTAMEEPELLAGDIRAFGRDLAAG